MCHTDPAPGLPPAAVREASRLLRPYHPGLDVEPFARLQVADAGDIACTPYDIHAAVEQIRPAPRSCWMPTRGW